jgi:hypothetical protein
MKEKKRGGITNSHVHIYTKNLQMFGKGNGKKYMLRRLDPIIRVTNKSK